jgi:hypothetical protein
MCSSFVRRCRLFPSIAFIAALTLLLSGWTCSAWFESCEGVGQDQAQVAALSPSSIPDDANSVPLIVEGSGFTPHSQIMWNGSTLQTTFLDSRHLRTTITQETFGSFGGSAGSRVQISVASQGWGCRSDGKSSALELAID